MNKLEELLLEGDFFFSVNFHQLKEIEKFMKNRKVPYTLMVCTGVFPVEGAKCVIDYSDEDSLECHFASINYLMKGKDGVVYELRKPNQKAVELPTVNDLFEVKELQGEKK